MGVVILIVWNSLAIFAPEKLSTLITIGFAGAAYMVSLLKLGALSPEEILAFPKGRKLLTLFRKLKLVKAEETE